MEKRSHTCPAGIHDVSRCLHAQLPAEEALFFSWQTARPSCPRRGKRRNWPWTTIERETDDNKRVTRKQGRKLKEQWTTCHHRRQRLATRERRTRRAMKQRGRRVSLTSKSLNLEIFPPKPSRDYDVSLCDVFCSLLK